jgi:hypothetical protein
MNDQEIGGRFRALAHGPEPEVPVALRRFVRDREFVEAAKSAGAAGTHRSLRIGGAVVGLAAVLLLVAAVAGPWISWRQGPGAASASPSAGPTASVSPSPTTGSSPAIPPTPVNTPTPVATPSASPRTLKWTMVSLPANATLPSWGMPIPSGGYFGGCSAGQTNGVPILKYCSSPDGVHWTMSSNALFSGIEPNAAAHGAGGYVMVADETSQSKAAVFRSTDAVNWTRVPAADVPQADLTMTNPDGSTQHGLTPMYAVVAGPNGFVAAGWHMEWQQAPKKPAVLWHSADGIKWTEETAPMGGSTFLWSVGNRYFLEGTSSASDSYSFQLWYSDDGVAWRQATAAAGSPQTTGVYAVTKLFDGSLMALAYPMSDPTGTEVGQDFSSTDGGATWHFEGDAKGSVPGTFAQIDGVINEGGFVSFDDGATWAQMADIPNGPQAADAGISLGNAFLVTMIDVSGIDESNPDAQASIDAAPILFWLGTP